MKECALCLWALAAPHHRWPMPPPPAPAAVVQPVPVPAVRQVDREELRKAIDGYCRRLKRGKAVMPMFR